MTQPQRCPFDLHVLAPGGTRLRVRVRGEGDPLLLLNGLTRPLESWEPFAERLTGRTTVSLDAPGVGGSPTPILPLSMARLAGLAVSVVDELGLDHADVLGYSHGGAVAQQMALQAPTRIRRLVLVSTSCGAGSTPGTHPRRRSRTSNAHPWPRPGTRGLLWNSLAISSWSSIPFLGAIACPTLVVCGTHDRVVPPENSRLLARRIQAARLVMLPAGHDLQRSGPADALAETVESFLKASDTEWPPGRS